MHWLQSLYETYDANRGYVGKYLSKTVKKKNGEETEVPITPLLPIYHTAQNAHITVVLQVKDDRAAFADARIVSESQQTIIPATEESEARTSSKIAPHALCDRLMYLAGNRPEFFEDEDTARLAFSGGYKNDGKKKAGKKELVVGYFETLNAWADSAFATPKLRAIRDYIAGGSLVSDLAAKGVITLDGNGKVTAKSGSGELSKALGQTEQFKALVRWEVELPNETEAAAWRDPALFDSWAKFREKASADRGFCYVSGKENAVLSEKHPKKIRNPGDGAKLISSNDENGFTYRGRFTRSREVCCVSAEVSQKAHSALRWLISRQGTVINGDFAVVAWCAGTVKIPLFLDDDDFDDDPGETHQAEQRKSLEANQLLGNKIVKNLLGYPAKLDEKEIRMVFVAAVDAASPGRLALICYKAFPQSRYFENLSRWYEECRWTFPGTKTSPSAPKTPTPQQIAVCAYGNAVSSKNKLLQNTVLRILPCIIERKAFPRDLVDACVARAATPNSFKEKYDWDSALAVACAVFRLRFNQENMQEKLTMNLDESRKTRDYLYGRLLALGEHLEASALKISEKKERQTKAEQLMHRFSIRPYSTWRTIELSLAPYRAILSKSPKSGGLRARIEGDIDEVMTCFDTLSGDDDFTNDAPLSGEFLLGYHCQRRRNFEKKNQDQNNEHEGE